MTIFRALWIAAIAVPLLAVSAQTSAADDILSWIKFPGVCYGYHPTDPNGCFGKYYPYSGEYCHRRFKQKRQVVKHVSASKVSYCSKKRRKKCSVFDQYKS
jgi:hypothetical protein